MARPAIARNGVWCGLEMRDWITGSDTGIHTFGQDVALQSEPQKRGMRVEQRVGKWFGENRFLKKVVGSLVY